MKTAKYSSPYGHAPKSDGVRGSVANWWILDDSAFVYSPEDFAMDAAYVAVGKQPGWFTGFAPRKRAELRTMMMTKLHSKKARHGFWKQLHTEYTKALVVQKLKS